jgi:hypothetical protein
MEVELEEEGITWVSRSKGWSYHIDCWNEHIDSNKEKSAADWFDLIFDLITRELHSSYDYHKIKAQADNFCNKGNLTMKGIYFTCYYFFIVKKQAYEPKYGIGIVPHIYEDASAYWLEQERKKNGIMKEIERIKTIEAGEARKINVKNRTIKKKVIAEPTFDDIT